MVVYYQIAGKKVGSHVLSMAVLGSIFAGSWAAMSGGEKPKTAAGPPHQRFFQGGGQFLKEVDGGKSEKH
ncbi:hypothetical protein N7509_005848 [Penicillium cosmopolitanum]|uniref:Uncharacterized protein n=1 Tax=Penicillium cosmopolitanum TaxID=1131564 RepID=A0A9W9W367_9EURO|nr:uncharacterized protein N7509_005848 [Penicillium cosmopolitanum]XP_057116574.1 uncharacterized protein N7481_013167 [Penicillium waksmanii]KAJ5397735.1 hypothetical protein N7509_005848 [Penicillium cosmopolitanum]KAJ5966453.1 hypothetical protein N7481_013167 [Penicillium waksmanii]